LPPAPAKKDRGQSDTLSRLPDGATLIEFTSDACPACRAMEPVLAAAREQCPADGATALQLDVESTAGSALAVRFDVTATPTLVLLDRDHIEAARLVGIQSLSDVRRTMERAFGIVCAARPVAPSSPSG
jgi:cytochrome c-type biogenesis protein